MFQAEAGIVHHNVQQDSRGITDSLEYSNEHIFRPIQKAASSQRQLQR